MRRHRGRVTWVAASLALNVFLLGTLAGGAWRASHRAPAAAPAHAVGIRGAAHALAPERRAQLQAALRATRRDNHALVLQARAGRADVQRALAAQPFDPAALADALARTRQADVALRLQVEQTIARFAGELSADERQRLVEAMAAREPPRAVRQAEEKADD